MATIKPFRCVRPDEKVVHRVAALPYDVYNREEAKEEVKKEPLSFLRIDRAETQFEEDIDIYDSKVYDKARELLDASIEAGIMISDEEEAYYIYELIMDGRSQAGIVACASIDDYMNNVIKKHEKTREDKEIDRIRHVDRCDAQTGPIFLAYRSNDRINQVVNEVMTTKVIYHFVSVDGVHHNVWKISNLEQIQIISNEFDKEQSIYIADGHHRTASAVKVGLKRREAYKEYTGEEEFNYFLSVLFPDDQLMILPYNRAVKDLNGYSISEFLQKVNENFEIKEMGTKQYNPTKRGCFGMYLDNRWYQLTAREHLRNKKDSVAGLDVSILQDYLLQPILDIKDPRVDKRIGFIGGIKGLDGLEKRVKKDMAVGFAMYPTSIEELFMVSDEDKLMPPKSTWFEPKLRSGIFIHKLSSDQPYGIDEGGN